MPDAVKVMVYRRDTEYPKPDTDTLLATDTTVSDGTWSVSASLAVGRHTIYSQSEDLAGNKSPVVGVAQIARLPVPFYVSETIDWYVGELNEMYLGLTVTS